MRAYFYFLLPFFISLFFVSTAFSQERERRGPRFAMQNKQEIKSDILPLLKLIKKVILFK